MQNNDNTAFTTALKTYGSGQNIKIASIQRSIIREQTPCNELTQLQFAINSLKLGIWTFDALTNSLMVCGRCRELIPALPDGYVKGSELMALLVTEHSRQVLECFQLALNTNASFDIEVQVVSPADLYPKWLRITGVSDQSDVFPQMHGTAEDISNRKRLELLKQDYLAIVSHDLRSPLSVIKLYIQLCEREANIQGNQFILETLKKSGLQVDKMNNLIECYLESSATGAGICYAPMRFDLQELFEQMIDDLRLLYPGYILLLKPMAGTMVFADRGKIGQVVQNLLSNAIKYSSQTEVITIKFQRTGNYVQVEIQDHGIGIETAEQKKIFDRFYRVDRVSETLVNGYGIGLYLTKQILKQHNGDIWLKSELNKGSKFYFKLPYSCP